MHETLQPLSPHGAYTLIIEYFLLLSGLPLYFAMFLRNLVSSAFVHDAIYLYYSSECRLFFLIDFVHFTFQISVHFFSQYSLPLIGPVPILLPLLLSEGEAPIWVSPSSPRNFKSLQD